MKKLIFSLQVLVLATQGHSQSWNITGNTNINPAIHFLGTTDNQALRFRVNNQFSGEIDSVYRRTLFGHGAGRNMTTGVSNVAIGTRALNSGTTMFNIVAIGTEAFYSAKTGSNAVAIGYRALYSAISGLNVAVGTEALYSNTTGYWNTGVGDRAMYRNTTGYYNTGIGNKALFDNTTGRYNDAFGSYALSKNTTGSFNVATGSMALFSNSTGMYNTAMGYQTFFQTTTSQYNTAVGYQAGSNYNMGWNNTIVGALAGGAFSGQYNIVAIGQGTICPDNSTVRIGNSASWSIGGYAGWTNFSDGRYKKGVKENVTGLEFIMKLRPVTYHLDIVGASKKSKENAGNEWDGKMKEAIAEKEKAVFTGFVAQEVEQAAKETGFEFSGVDKPRNEYGFYGLRYAEFVVPLVKAMQEQQQIINDLQKKINELEKKLSNSNYSVSHSGNTLHLWPNPSDNKIFLAIEADSKSQILIRIFDNKGSLVKQQQAIVLQGSNQLNIDIKELANGTYHVLAEWKNGQVKKTAQIIKG